MQKSKRKGKAKASEPEEEDPEPEPAPQRKQKGKRKAIDDEDIEDAEIVAGPTVKKKASRATNETKEAGGKTKVKHGGSKQPTARSGRGEEEEDEAPDAVKKKKRKILPSLASGPFAFGNLKLSQVSVPVF